MLRAASVEAGLTPERGPVILDATDLVLVLHKNQSSSRGEAPITHPRNDATSIPLR